MTDILPPEQYLETLRVAIAQKKDELEKIELMYAKMIKALAPDGENRVDARELKRQRIAEAQKKHHKRRREEMADRIIKEVPNWKQYKNWELAQKIDVTIDAINRIFEEDERFKN